MVHESPIQSDQYKAEVQHADHKNNSYNGYMNIFSLSSVSFYVPSPEPNLSTHLSGLTEPWPQAGDLDLRGGTRPLRRGVSAAPASLPSVAGNNVP